MLFLGAFIENPPNLLKPVINQENTQTSKPPVPVYIPTPKHILEARKSNGSGTTEECPPSKKPKLEYVPKAISNNSEPIPTYIPSSVPTSNDEYEPSPVFGKEDTTPNTIEGDLNDDISGLLTELSSEQITNNENRTENVPNDSKQVEETNDLKESKEQKSKENSHKSSSSSRHRHHSSSSSSTHKSSHSNRKSSSRSSSSTHKSSSSSHHSSRKSKHSDKDKEKSRHSSKSSSKESRHKSEHRSKSSSSSSSSSRHHSSNHSDKKIHNSNNNNKTKNCIQSSVVYETDSEEDDVEAQCRMIFEEFDPSTLENKHDEMPNDSATSAEEDDSSSSKVDDVTKKKRLAHENADKQIKSITPFKRNADHVKNALQV